MANLLELFRGEPWVGPSRYLQLANQGTPSMLGGASTGLTSEQLAKLAGQYWTEDPNLAERYAGKSGKIKSMKVPSNYIDKFDRFQSRVTSLPSGNYTNAGVYKPSHLVPKSTIKNYPSKINLGKTISNFMGNLDYPGKTIKAGYDLYGPGYALKDLGSHGLGFLKNNAFRTLKMLGSLQGQAGIMALSPTMMGNAELPQMPQGSPTQINQGGGNGGGGYQPTTTAQNRARTASRVGPGGNVKAYGLADGGLIDLYRYGGFI
tara:strand:- start:6 stop:791 length:786 start_codon:yes stop_codon:yes gene_type:complete